MKLHSKEQLSKQPKKSKPDEVKSEEAEQKTAKKPFAPTKEGYLQFLVDSLAVYVAFEEAVAASSPPSELAKLQKTGMERTQALTADIAWMCEEYGLAEPSRSERGLGYAEKIVGLGKDNAPGFVCHFYNHYFAHTAGGLMIGKMVRESALGGAKLNFYKWDGNVAEHKKKLKLVIDGVAAEWSEEERQKCVTETAASFKFGGGLMKPLRD